MSETRSKEETGAIDFLLFSYFGVTLGDDAALLREDAVRKAYGDATQRGAFNTSASPKASKGRDAAKEKGTDKLIERLEVLCEGVREATDDSPFNFDVWHHESCLAVRSCYREKGINEFTYGNAQKWVNMTLKYLYVLHGLTKCEGLDFIGRIADQLHVPVDSYIIESVWEDETVSLPIIESKLLKDGSRGKYSSNKVLSWSNWDCDENERCDEYDSFQKSLRTSLSNKYRVPIEWEGPAWIEQAKKRKRG